MTYGVIPSVCRHRPRPARVRDLRAARVLGAAMLVLTMLLPAAAQAQGFSVTAYPGGPDNFPQLEVAMAFDGVEVFAEGSYSRSSRVVDGEVTGQSSVITVGGGGRFFFTAVGDVDVYAAGGLSWIFPDGTGYDSGSRFRVGAGGFIPVGSRWGLVAEAGLLGRSTDSETSGGTITVSSWDTYSVVGLRIEI